MILVRVPHRANVKSNVSRFMRETSRFHTFQIRHF